MKVLTIILTAITLSQSSYAIFNENFYKSDRIKKLVTDQFEALQEQYYEFMTLAISKENQKNEYTLAFFKQYNELQKKYQKYVSNCININSPRCLDLRNSFVINLSEILENSKKNIHHLKGIAETSSSDIKFVEDIYALTLSSYFETQLQSINMSVKETILTSFEFYRLLEIIKSYIFGIQYILADIIDLKIKNELYDFWINFVFQSHYLTATEHNIVYFSDNFTLMNKTLYDFLYKVHNLNIKNNIYSNQATLMQTRWNYIRKLIYTR
ncbi:MAG: hypothetical protein H6620_06285 [Halobacteriovoraceae bacterium]|nr:hypothetical protein [Halobacteriovoraceae bacterium]